MKKTFIFILVTLFIFAGIFESYISAKELAPTPFPSSYELFYPIVAGKIPTDKYYFLKSFKEWLADKFIVDLIRNADYHLVLSKKRFVEGEKLFFDKNYSLAEKSLAKSLTELKKSIATAKKAEAKGVNVSNIYTSIKTVANNEADLAETFLIKNVPETEIQFLLNISRSFRELTQQR